MDYAKKYKWALSAFIIMVLLNLGTLISIWTMRPSPALPEDQRNHRMVQRYMARELDLSPEQRMMFQQLRKEHMENTRVLAEELQENRRKYFQLFMAGSGEIDSVQADSLSALISRNYIQLEESVFSHLAEVKARLNPDQQDKFEELTLRGLFRDPMNMNAGPGSGMRRRGNP